MSRFLFSFLCIQLLLSSCKVEKNKFIKISEYAINTDGLAKNKKEIDYENRFGLEVNGDEVKLINLSKSNTVLFFNLIDGSYSEIKTTIENKDVDAIRYNEKDLFFIKEKALFNFHYGTAKTDSLFPLEIADDEFIIHNLYSETIFKYNDWFFIQYGKENKYNMVDDKALLFFKKDSSKRMISTSAEFSQYYIQYNDLCIASIKDTLFYTYATLPAIYKHPTSSNRTFTKKLDSNGFLKFDTSKIKDMLYISDYTFATTYNVKLLCGNKYIYLIQRYQEDKKNYYKLMVFDTSLKLISNSSINHAVDPNFIFHNNNKLIFLAPKNRKRYEYTFF